MFKRLPRQEILENLEKIRQRTIIDHSKKIDSLRKKYKRKLDIPEHMLKSYWWRPQKPTTNIFKENSETSILIDEDREITHKWREARQIYLDQAHTQEKEVFKFRWNEYFFLDGVEIKMPWYLTSPQLYYQYLQLPKEI